MRRWGLYLALLGLIVGVAVGTLGKGYLASLLISLLDEEVRESTGCSLQYERASLTLFPLKGKVRKARFDCGAGTPPLMFSEIRVAASLSEIRNKIVHLSEVRLINGHADGVGEKSITYKFIDHLTAPPPPEKRRPDRWKVVLDRLTVEHSSFIENFRTSRLSGEDVALTVEREGKDYVLTPMIGNLEVQYPAPSYDKKFNLGQAKGSLTIFDDTVAFHKLLLSLGNSWVNVLGTSYTKEKNRLEGNVSYSLDAASLGLIETIQTTLNGEGAVGGTLGSPQLESKYATPLGGEFVIKDNKASALTLSSLSGLLSVDVNHGNPIVRSHQIEGEGEGVTVSGGSCSYQDDIFHGEITLSIDTIGIEDLLLDKVSLNLTAHGPIDAPDLQVTLSASDAIIQGYSLGDVQATFSPLKESIPFHISNTLKSLIIEGQAHSENGALTLSSTSVVADRFQVFDLAGPSPTDALDFSGQGIVKGRLLLGELQGEGQLAVNYLSSPILPLFSGPYSLEKGILSYTAQGFDGSLRGKAALDLLRRTPSKVDFSLARFTSPSPSLDQNCFVASLQGTYQFPLLNPESGNGSVHLGELKVGCAPYTMTARSPTPLPISNGKLSMSSIVVEGNMTSLQLRGGVSLKHGYDVEAQGRLSLEHFLPFLPSFDHLSGLITASLQAKGSLGSPTLGGSFSLLKGEFADEGSGIIGEEITGSGMVKDSTLVINTLSGEVNGGKFSGQGTIPFTTPLRGVLSVGFDNILLQPSEDLSAILKGSISLQPSPTPGRLLLKGTVLLSQAEFQRSLDFQSVVKALGEFFTSRSPAYETKNNTLSLIDLDISVGAARNVMIVSNIIEADLRANLQVRGTLDAPLIEGSMETLSGWFGLKDRRFQITSGRIIFESGKRIPSIEVLGETQIKTPYGDVLGVLLEAQGPLISPRISLSSERGLSQQQILNLLTATSPSASPLTVTSQVQRYGVGLEYSDFSLLNKDASLFENLLYRITKIDTLSVEPTYNPVTGRIEPTVLASKRLTPQLTLLGEGIFGGSITRSSASLLFQLSPRVGVLGSILSASTNAPTSFGADITSTLIFGERPPTVYTLKGQSRFDKNTVLEFAKLRETTIIAEEDLPEITRRIEEKFREKGFPDTVLKLECKRRITQDERRLCRTLVINVDEGERARIERIEVVGINHKDIFSSSEWEAIEDDARATAEFMEEITSTFRRRLREEGYYSARISGQFLPTQDLKKPILLLNVEKGRKIKFVFIGNQKFNADELLGTINLLNRRLPFGNHSISVLMERIERLYREAGYLYATIDYQRKDDPLLNETVYLITIQEEEEVPVSEVRFEGNAFFTKKELLKLYEKGNSHSTENLLHPQVALDEQVEQHAAELEALYKDEGFLEAQIRGSITPVSEGQGAIIAYAIFEGKRTVYSHWEILHAPEGIVLPPFPEILIPRTRAEYEQSLLREVKNAGYLHAEITSQESTPGIISFEIHSGDKVFIRNIHTEGTRYVKNETVLREAALQTGSPWDLTKIQEARLNLLRLGLFSKVVIAPADGALDTAEEELVIKVTERPLRSLKVGVGANSEFGLHLLAEGNDKQFFGDGRGLNIRSDVYWDPRKDRLSQGTASVSYTIPRIFQSPISFVNDFRFQKLTNINYEFDVERIGESVSLFRSWVDGFTATLSHSFTLEALNNVSPDAILTSLDSGTLLLSTVNASLGYDFRDDPLNPTEGGAIVLEGKASSEALGSDANYAGALLRGSYLMPLTPRWSVTVASRLGALVPWGSTEEVPITERYYLGGRTTVRGFRENSLGPRGRFGSVIGGDLVQANTLQFQYLIADRLQGITFFDSGNVFLRRRSSDITHQRLSTGAGIRYLSPIGPIGVDVGIPLDERSGEPSVRLHFSIGSPF